MSIVKIKEMKNIKKSNHFLHKNGCIKKRKKKTDLALLRIRAFPDYDWMAVKSGRNRSPVTVREEPSHVLRTGYILHN